MGDANSGLEQGRRREMIVRLEEEVASATSYEQLQQAARSIQEAMAAMPSESALYRLNAQVERQIKEHENRILVDETVQACRNVRPREALDLVRKARLKLPGDERLLSLEALLANRVKMQSVEERRADYLARAREALEASQYADAVRILETCQAEGLATGEILSLLDFARTEELEHRRQEQLRAKLAHAQALIGDSAYDEAVTFLEDSLQQADDTALHMLLDQAASGRESLRQQTETALTAAANLAKAGKQDEAREFLKGQPQPVLRSSRVQISLAALEEERTQALFRTVGRAYAGLGINLPAGEAVMRRALAASGNSPLFAPIADALHRRGRVFADRVVADSIQNAKNLLRDHNRDAAGQALQTVSGMVDYASTETRLDWQNTQRKASQTSLISRLRN